MSYSSLKDKVVFITGASSGIGGAGAVEFARNGSKVVLTARNIDNLNKVAQRCREAGAPDDNILVAQGDTTKEEDVARVIKQIMDKFGQIDVLINSAGVLNEASIQNCDLSKFDHLFNVNVRGVLLVTKEVVPYLLKTKGNVINVSSITGLRPMEDALFYAMSKAAMDQMTRICATELAPKGVRVNSINPGVIVTELHRSAGYSEERYQQYIHDASLLHPLGRPGYVDDTSQALLYLASAESSFVTGVTLPIDGGRVCVTPRYVTCSRHDDK